MQQLPKTIDRRSVPSRKPAMSENYDASSSPPPPPERPPLTVIPVPPPLHHAPPAPPPRGPSAFSSVLRGFFVMAFLGMFGLIVFLILLFVAVRLPEDGGSGSIYERYHSGDKKATNKIAVVKMEGVIMEGLIGFAQKEIEEAARDDNVKAVV